MLCRFTLKNQAELAQPASPVRDKEQDGAGAGLTVLDKLAGLLVQDLLDS